MTKTPYNPTGSPKFLLLLAVVSALVVLAIGTTSRAQTNKTAAPAAVQAAVLARLNEIQSAAQSLDVDKVFSFVLENDSGAVAQNGRLFLTRQEALESTKRGFEQIQKVEYQFGEQHVTLLAPTVALAVGEGTTSATTRDGQTFTTHFVQSVVLVLTNGQWNVLHAHRSSAAAR
jgi:hypothetical protein